MNITTEQFKQAKESAQSWQEYISNNREGSEKDFHEIMKRMLRDPLNKVFLIELLDQSFRSKNPHRVADQLEFLFEKYSNTSFFSELEKVLIWLFRTFGIYMPQISIPLFIKYLRYDIHSVVIEGEESPLMRHLKKRKKEGTRVNINIIGEIVLGEDEAKSRVEKYIKALRNPNIDYISIKISTIFSQINPLAHEWSVEQISSRLELIYDEAIANEHKFVNLDMEEYKDLNLTIDTFIKTLSTEKYHHLYAGIVIQTYMPDALQQVKKLVAWAKQRVQDGGVPIKIRLVKGANQEMELTEASLRGWNSITYDEKAKSDANFKLVMDYMLSPDVAPYAHIGIASHNLFDQALATVLAKHRGVEQYCSAEMLEGMSETAYKLLKKEGINVVLYAPIATAQTFTNAIAYLVRRFDENTAEQNFLRHSFGLDVGTPAWDTLIKSYDDSIKAIEDLKLTPMRTQDRNTEAFTPITDVKEYVFKNESDTDFALPQNVKWAQSIKEKWQYIGEHGGFNAVSIIGGKSTESDDVVSVIDKSQFHKDVIVGTYKKASKDDLICAVEIAKEDPDNWRGLDLKSRQKILMQVANEVRKDRGDLIGVAAAEVGKVFNETDVEVSEAIDFLNFYPYSVKKIEELEGIKTSPKGVGMVISPWNFPIAIPVGGIAAALACGNTVIFKPASISVLCAYRLCECFWNAGVSKNTLQLVIADAESVGETLVANKEIDFTIFTGGEKTAYEMIKTRPDIHLSAETGGKDATIVTALADRDQAVKNVLQSAFNNSGQKCSATSLLVLEKELYNDANFRNMLVDAASSLQVGSVWEFQNRIGTLSSKPSGNLAKSLTYLDEGEEWVLEPSYTDDNPYMLKPSIRWGTIRKDFCHMNELFGPVLSVMCANDLEHAIEIVNSTGYGLTSGIESLDEREQNIWKESLHAGNLYLNRVTTGAIVTRQPFGGMGKSAIGSGKKAGGYNYVSQFMNISYADSAKISTLDHPYIEKIEKLLELENLFIQEIQNARTAAQSFAYWIDKEFSKEHDYTNIRGESNVIRYLPFQDVLLRFENDTPLDAMIASIAAVKMSNAQLKISLPEEITSDQLKWLETNINTLLDDADSMSYDDEKSLIVHIKNSARVRILGDVSDSIYDKIASNAIYLSSEPYVAHGRIEMMHYYIEQSVSDSYHRYGNLGLRGLNQERSK